MSLTCFCSSLFELKLKMLKVVGASWVQTKISSYVLGILGVLAILALFLGEIERIQDDGNYAATVFWTEKSGFRIEYWGQSNELATIPKGVARAYFRQDNDVNGWSQLEIESEGSYPDWVQAYAAGLLEGALTWQQIYSHWENTVADPCENNTSACKQIRTVLEESFTSINSNVTLYEHIDPYWHQVGLFYKQIEGIYTGWNYGVKRSRNEYELERSDFMWLNSLSEIKELSNLFNISIGSQIYNTNSGKSSAFAKIIRGHVQDTDKDISNMKKIFIAHNKPESISSALRQLKRYKLGYHLTADPKSSFIPTNATEFSGHPATITSHDDMYILKGINNHLLAVTGTDIDNFNEELWKYIDIIREVPLGPRITAANHLAMDGQSWGDIIASNNSGTGCKQWMVVDFTHLNDQEIDTSSGKNLQNNFKTKISSTMDGANNNINHTILHRVTDGANIPRGLIYQIEQVPGLTHMGDLSDAFTDKGYWTTDGFPLFQNIRDITHTNQKQVYESKTFTRVKYNQEFDTQTKNATDLEAVIKLLRNKYVMDKLIDKYISSNDKQNEINHDNNIDIVQKDTEKDVKCLDGSFETNRIDCFLKDKEWNLVYGNEDEIQKDESDVLDTKVFSGNNLGVITEFAAVSGPIYPDEPHIKQLDFPYLSGFSTGRINKGNVAAAFKNNEKKQNIHQNLPNSLEIENLIKQERDSKFGSDSKPNKFMYTLDAFRPRWAW